MLYYGNFKTKTPNIVKQIYQFKINLAFKGYCLENHSITQYCVCFKTQEQAGVWCRGEDISWLHSRFQLPANADRGYR